MHHPHLPYQSTYVNPTPQPYPNPSFIPQNQNYYTSPVITNPPLPNNYPTQDPYANYYNYLNTYYPNGYTQPYPYYGAPMAAYPAFNQSYCQPCAGYQQTQYPQGNCQCLNCADYGLPFINKDRITPKFPQKLPHSFVTSGDQVQNKLVINEPTSESAPFQSQRRKTYQPYTRKYIEYQDYIQYVPVQRSQWIYKKVMKQIDFVPKEYYETSVQTVPREKLDYKIRYLPVEKEFVHFPKEVLDPPKPQIIQPQVIQPPQVFSNQSEIRIIADKTIKQTQSTMNTTMNPNSYIRPSIHFSHGNSVPLHSSKVIRASNPPIDGSKVLRTIYQQNSSSPFVVPVESTVEIVPPGRVQPFVMDSSEKSGTFGAGSHQFPQTGGVLIGGGSNPSNFRSQNPAFSSFGPRNGFDNQNQHKVGGNIEASEVIHSGYGGQGFENNPNIIHVETQKEVIYTRNFRESGHVQSQDFNFDPEVYKKQSMVNRLEEEYPN